MALRCGIVGLPNVGKSTLFTALTNTAVPRQNYPFCTIDPHCALAEIYDPRLYQLGAVMKSEKIIAPSLEITDIAGLVPGASQGEGLGNQFLAQIREVDAVLHVVRCFDHEKIVHVEGSCDPLRDIEIIDLEFILADLSTMEKALQRQKKAALSQGPQSDARILLCILEELYEHLERSQPARTFKAFEELDKTQHQSSEKSPPKASSPNELVTSALRNLHLLSAKKQIYICNMSDEDIIGDAGAATKEETENSTPHQHYYKQVQKHAQQQNTHPEVLRLCAQLESELAELDSDEDKRDMLSQLGLAHSGLELLCQKAYDLLGLFHYFTAGERETRAWTIPQGTKAPAAAGVIHSDFEHGFICAEVCEIDNLLRLESKTALKEAGLLRTEGKDYVVRNGDVLEFRFNMDSRKK